MFLVIAMREGRIVAVEQAGDHEDWPPSPQQIAGRWLAQRVIRDRSQVQVWTENAGWYWTRLPKIPDDNEPKGG
jgi:hypothetical protein